MDALITQESPRSVTYEELMQALMEDREHMRALFENWDKETEQREKDRVLREKELERREKSWEQSEKDRALREKELERQEKEWEPREKSWEQGEKDRALREKELVESRRKFDEFKKSLGDLNNRFGELAEHLVAPSIMEKFNELGFDFDRISNNVKLKKNKGAFADAEIDILLENGDVAIAVEVKAKPKECDVDDHIKRMEVLRRDADRKQDKRKYIGAVAGAIMGESVRNYTMKKGFYLIEQTGDTVKITVPEGFTPREW